MNRKPIIQYFENHLALSVLFVCLAPYISLLVYLAFGMHSIGEPASDPNPTLLFIFFAAGVPFPLCGVAIVLRRLVHQRQQFRLRMLLSSYLSLVLVFATGYAILQASSLQPAIEGMTVVWEPNTPTTIAEHRERLHWLYFDALYLSLITITTVGYGDMIPISPWAKLLAGFEGLSGVAFLGLALGHHFSVCLHQRDCQGAQSQPTENSL